MSLARRASSYAVVHQEADLLGLTARVLSPALVSALGTQGAP
jgi:hypothetical protein